MTSNYSATNVEVETFKSGGIVRLVFGINASIVIHNSDTSIFLELMNGPTPSNPVTFVEETGINYRVKFLDGILILMDECGARFEVSQYAVTSALAKLEAKS